jgi:hypothetical protein
MAVPSLGRPFGLPDRPFTHLAIVHSSEELPRESSRPKHVSRLCLIWAD